jgi:hypothetical protein
VFDELRSSSRFLLVYVCAFWEDDLPGRRLPAAPAKESGFLVCVLLRSTRRRKARMDINRPFAYGIARSVIYFRKERSSMAPR